MRPSIQYVFKLCFLDRVVIKKHTKEYVIKYIQRHLSKDYPLPEILEHLKKHNVDTDTIYEALKEIKIVPQNIVVRKQKEEPEIQETSFIEELTYGDYIIFTLLGALFVLALLSSVAVTIFLLITVLCAGFIYAGSKRWPQYLLLVVNIIGIITLLAVENTVMAVLFGSFLSPIIYILWNR